jgi:hypothetical protein
MKPNVKSCLNSLLIVALSITGSGFVLHATSGGIGVINDSAFYVGVARSLTDGYGIGLNRPHIGFEFFSVFPPLTSLVLAGLNIIGLEMITTARWMNAILFGLTIVVAGGIFLKKCPSPLPAFLVAALLTFSPSLIDAHVWLMSEPLYYFMATISLLGLAVYLTESRWSWLVISAVAAAMAALDRYAGLSLAPAAILVLIFQPGINFRLRLKQTGVYGLISLTPSFVWLLISQIKSGTFAGREPLSMIYTLPKVREIIPSLKLTVINWIPFSEKLSFISDPHQYKPFWAILILLAISLVLWAIWLAGKLNKKNGEKVKVTPLLILCLVFMVCHMLVYTVAKLFLNNSPAIGDRNFAPLLFSGYFLLGALVSIFLQAYHGNARTTFLIYLVCSVIVLLNGINGLQIVKSYPSDGMGYNTTASRGSPIYTAIRYLPESLLIVCNNPNMVLFHSNRYAYPLIEEYTHNPEWDFPVYGKGRDRTDRGQVIFDQGQAALVLLPDAYWELQEIYFDKIELRMIGLTSGLYLYYSGLDGSIYVKDASVLYP